MTSNHEIISDQKGINTTLPYGFAGTDIGIDLSTANTIGLSYSYDFSLRPIHQFQDLSTVLRRHQFSLFYTVIF